MKRHKVLAPAHPPGPPVKVPPARPVAGPGEAVNDRARIASAVAVAAGDSSDADSDTAHLTAQRADITVVPSGGLGGPGGPGTASAVAAAAPAAVAAAVIDADGGVGHASAAGIVTTVKGRDILKGPEQWLIHQCNAT